MTTPSQRSTAYSYLSHPFVVGAAGFAIGAATAYITTQPNTLLQSIPHGVAPSHTLPPLTLPLPLRSTRRNPPLQLTSLTNKQSLSDIQSLSNKRILIRVDYNVKVKNSKVIDRRRIDATIPTLRALIDRGGFKCLVLITHLGRPTDNHAVDCSLEPVAKCLQTEYFPKQIVRFLPDCIGDDVEHEINSCQMGTIFLLENLRFHAAETGIRIIRNTETGSIQKEKVSFSEKVAFRQALSRLGDIYVFEAFGAAHRPHSSIIGIQIQQRVAGLLMAKELSYYGKVLGQPKRPMLAIIGGAKISDKILVLENLLNLVDEMIIGGGMAYTFLSVIYKIKIGASLYDESGSKVVESMMRTANNKGVRIHLPVDHIIADAFKADAHIGICSNDEGIPLGWMGLDIGPRTRADNGAVMSRANTIIWNGPMGVYEFGAFGGGTLSAMYDIVQATHRGAVTIIGGGDTGAASKHFYVGGTAVSESVSHVSTGGGSSLVLMEGKQLPAVGTLSDIGSDAMPPAQTEENELIDDSED